MFRGAKDKLSPSKRPCFALQNTVFCNPKHISFTKNPSFLIFHPSSLFPKHICFTRLKLKKIPTKIFRFFGRYNYQYEHSRKFRRLVATAREKSFSMSGKRKCKNRCQKKRKLNKIADFFENGLKLTFFCSIFIFVCCKYVYLCSK